MRDAPGAMETEQGVEFTMREWEQVWAHTRHLETMRGQYLGFFFTAVLGVAALAGPRLATDSLRGSGELLTVAALTVGLELLSGFLYLAVTRLNEVLRYYMKLTVAIREWMLQNGAAFNLGDFTTPPPPPRPWAGASGIARGVVKAGLVGFPLISMGVIARSIDLSGFSLVTWFCVIALLMNFGIVVWVIRGSALDAVAL